MCVCVFIMYLFGIIVENINLLFTIFFIIFFYRCCRVFLIRSITKENYNMAVDKKAFKRLPKSIKPMLYDLYLKPDLQKFTFEGKETVSVNVSIILPPIFYFFQLFNIENNS